MDEFVKNKLQEWGLEAKLSETFADHEIDEEVFSSLTENNVTELIPTLGIRKKFLAKFYSYKMLTEAIEKEPIFSSTSTETTVSEYPGESDTSSIISSPSDINTENLIPGVSYSTKATLGQPYVISQYVNSVRKLIDDTEEGKIVLASYDSNRKFNRNKLCEVIIKNEYKNNKEKKITSQRFIELANEINDVFFHESHEIYYVPYVNNPGGKPKAARGKLWSTYCYMRSQLKSLGLLQTSSSSQFSERDHSLHIKDITELETELELRRKKYSTFNLTAQTLPVIVGEIHNVAECYVCIDDVKYKIDNPVKAVDVCFKVFHGLNAEYPKEADPVWTFLQTYIYEIKTKSDNKYVSVNSLIADLDLLLHATT